MNSLDSIQLASIFRWLDAFFFDSVSNLPISFFRIFLGLIIAFFTLKAAPDFKLFLSYDSLYPNKDYLKIRYYGFSIFDLFPKSIFLPAIFPYLIFITSLLFAVGIFTNYVNVLLYVFWMSLNRRAGIIRSSGDSLITIFLFYLMFSDAGSSLSIDRWLLDGTLGLNSVYRAWPLRLLQFQICAIYLNTYHGKIESDYWRSGTAIKNASSTKTWGRAWSRPFICTPWVAKTLNFMTLVLQALLPILLWPKETRAIAIFLGISMHLGMMLFLEVAEFGPIMVCSYILFFDPKILQNFIAFVGM